MIRIVIPGAGIGAVPAAYLTKALLRPPLSYPTKSI